MGRARSDRLEALCRRRRNRAYGRRSMGHPYERPRHARLCGNWSHRNCRLRACVGAERIEGINIPHSMRYYNTILGHASDCAICSGPARWPMACDCHVRGGTRSGLLSRPIGCSPVSALQRWLHLWQARIFWKRENRASLAHFLLIAATRSVSGPRHYRIPRDAAQLDVVSIGVED